MTKVTKKSKVTKFFNKNPTATVREAATATGVSYNTAWAARKDIQAIADEAIGLPSRKDFDKWLHRGDKTSSVVRLYFLYNSDSLSLFIINNLLLNLIFLLWLILLALPRHHYHKILHQFLKLYLVILYDQLIAFLILHKLNHLHSF